MENSGAVLAGNDEGIIFDSTSGISEDEQREILAEINSITEKNRRLLSAQNTQAPIGEKEHIHAKKSGAAFPLIVNIAALLVLAGGIFLLAFFHGKETLEFQEGTVVYNSAERALIQEIRRETASRIDEKENEISLMTSKLTGIDAELRELHSNNQELTAEQLAAEAELQRLGSEYRRDLSTLQDERSQILEASRAREAGLHAQLEARTRELSAASEQTAQSRAALNSAQGELERLSGEQEKTAVIESQLGAFFSAANGQIRGGQLAEASVTLETAREFLNTPAFRSNRSIQSRASLYNEAITSLEGMITEARKREAAATGTAAPDSDETEKTIADLRAENERLAENIASLNRTVAAYNSQGSDLSRQIAGYEERIAALSDANSNQQRAANERDAAITNLESQNSSLTQTVAARDTTIADQSAQIENLNAQLTSIRQALQALTQ
jgi:chromosome segregation ATPase